MVAEWKKGKIFRGSNHFGGISVILSFVKSIDSTKEHDKRNEITQRSTKWKEIGTKEKKVRKVVYKQKKKRKEEKTAEL